MTPADFAALAERARATHPATSPPADLFTLARAAARRHRARVVVVTVLFVALAGGGATAVARHAVAAPSKASESHSPRPRPHGTRLVGVGPVVIAVPSSWSTETEQGSYCGPQGPEVVHFFLPWQGPIGSCARPIGWTEPANTLTISYTSPVEAPAGVRRSGTVAGMPYFLTKPKAIGDVESQTLVIPAAQVRFEVTATTVEEARALLQTLRPTPDGMAAVTIATQGAGQAPVLGTTGPSPLRAKVVEIPDPTHVRGSLPGQLIGTVPAIGTPVPDGSTVTVQYTAGDLDAYVTSRSLQAAGWTVTAADRFTPDVTRDQAFRAVPNKYPDGGSGGNYGIYLRRLDDRLVWIVAIHPNVHHMLRLTAIDAMTARVVADHVFPSLD